MKNILMLLMSVVIICSFTVAFAQEMADYLILQDIGLYQISRPEKLIPGFQLIGGPKTYDGAGVLSGAGHSPDHLDKTYEVMYLGGDANTAPTVQVTQHTGGDSDKWLLHEAEDSYRDGDDVDGRLGLLSGAGVKLREISGNRFIYWGLGGGSYIWISGQKVIEIKYTDMQRTKPEPLEVITAYLQKFPSTIPSSLVLDKAHDTQWTKDEMERRLWLCDKWFEQLAAGKTDQKNALEYVIKSMNVFLDYREKYYKWSALEEKGLLAQYQQTGNEAKLREKLSEYKDWWSANKSTSFIGMITTCPQRLWSQARFYFKRLLVQLTSLPGQLLAMFG